MGGGDGVLFLPFMTNWVVLLLGGVLQPLFGLCQGLKATLSYNIKCDCPAGKIGPQCENDCPANKWGKNCAKTCA